MYYDRKNGDAIPIYPMVKNVTELRAIVPDTDQLRLVESEQVFWIYLSYKKKWQETSFLPVENHG